MPLATTQDNYANAQEQSESGLYPGFEEQTDPSAALKSFFNGLAIYERFPEHKAMKLWYWVRKHIDHLSTKNKQQDLELDYARTQFKRIHDLAMPYIPELDGPIIGFTEPVELVDRLTSKLKTAKNVSDAMYMDMVGLAKKMGKEGGWEGMTYGYVHHEVQKAVGELLRKSGEVAPEGYEFCGWKEAWFVLANGGLCTVVYNNEVEVQFRTNVDEGELICLKIEDANALGLKPVRRIGAIEEVTEDKPARKKPGPKPKAKDGEEE